MGFLILAAILLLIAFILIIPLKINVCYDGGLYANLKILFLKFRLYPEKTPKKSLKKSRLQKLRRKLKKQEKNSDKIKRSVSKEIKKEKKKSFSDIISLVNELTKLVLGVMRRLFKYLKITIHALNITVATGDAASCALVYTGVSQGLNFLLWNIDEYTNNSKGFENVSCRCDYAANTFSCNCDIEFRIRVWQAINVAVLSLYNLLKTNLMNGGSSNGK